MTHSQIKRRLSDTVAFAVLSILSIAVLARLVEWGYRGFPVNG